MLILGYLLAVFVGLSLGVLGTGGAILTIPIFVYVWDFQDKQAVASGFIIVVLVGVLAAWRHYRNGNINFRLLSYFAPTTMIGTHFGVTFSTHVPGTLQLMMLAGIMVSSAVLMLWSEHTSASPSVVETSLETNGETRLSPTLLMFLGMGVGLLVGLVGIGGGFIILPILINLAKVPMRQAIGTTLVVAILNSVVGSISSLQHTIIPWEMVLSFASVAIIGGFIGSYVNNMLSVSVLKKAFATLLIIVAGAIVLENFLMLNRGGSLISMLF